jgi:hypothetical protein
MLRNIQLNEMHLIKDDPVRPHIPAAWRVRKGKEVFVLENEQTKNIDAVVCVIYMDEVPTSEQDLSWPGIDIAVFYTVWSYSKGSGRDIIFAAQKHIHKKNANIKRFVTLSPLTDMATEFHLRNGAKLIGRHETCQNFEYQV